jgi:hypothetical protein
MSNNSGDKTLRQRIIAAVSRVVIPNLPLFAKNQSEVCILLCVAMTVARYGRLDFVTKQLYVRKLGDAHCSVYDYIDRRSFYNSFPVLVERGLLIPSPKDINRRPWRSSEYNLNLPAIIYAVFEQYPSAFGVKKSKLPEFISLAEELREVNKKFGIIMNKLPVVTSEGGRMEDKIKEKVEAAKKKSVAARNKRLARAKVKPPQELKPQDLFELMMEVSQEFGISYFEPAWRRQDYRSFKTWIGYCKEIGKDPRELIKDVMENWASIRMGALRSDKGMEVILSNSASFVQYFQFRRSIEAWLHTNVWVPRERFSPNPVNTGNYGIRSF